MASSPHFKALPLISTQTSPVTQTTQPEVVPSLSATNLHPQRSRPLNLQSPRADNTDGCGKESAVANHEPSIQVSVANPDEIARLFPDALKACFQEEIEKAMREELHRIVNVTTKVMINEFHAVLEERIKMKVATAFGPDIALALTPAIEEGVSSAITELEESLSAEFKSIVTPPLERSCKAMLEKLNSAFQKRIAECESAAEKRFDSQLALSKTLKETARAASSLAWNLSLLLSDLQEKVEELNEISHS